LRRWLKEPLLHFALLGVALFALYRLTSGQVESGGEIVVDAQRVESLAEQFGRTWGRPPTKAELDGLIDGYVRDEILYREGVALGLDRDDPVIRSRVRMKMEILDDTPESNAPDAELEAWLAANPDRYSAPARYDFEQVFFDPAEHGSDLDAEITAALHALHVSPDRDFIELGDATLLPPAMSAVVDADVASQFGPDFAATLAEGPTGEWFGPVTSAYGRHLVRIVAREERRVPTLAEVRAEVERDVLYERSQATSDATYERLRAGYEVRIEKPSGAPPGAVQAVESR